MIAKRAALHVFYIMIILLLSACGQTLTPEVPQDNNEVTPLAGARLPNALETSMINAINEMRQEGYQCSDDYYEPASTLRWSAALAGAAKTHLNDLLEREEAGEFDLADIAPPHKGSDGHNVAQRAHDQNYDFKRIAENTASISTRVALVRAVVRYGWAVSTSGHCSSMMDKYYQDIGVAYENGVWVAVFAEPR